MKNNYIKQIKKILKQEEWTWEKNIKNDFIDRCYNLSESNLYWLIGQLKDFKVDFSEHQVECDYWIEASIYYKYSVIIDNDVNFEVDIIEEFAEQLEYYNTKATNVIKELKEGIKI